MSGLSGNSAARINQHVLLSDQDLRTAAAASAIVGLVIIFWLIRLRADALDITFERIFFGLFLFQDYAIALAAFVALVLALLPACRVYGLALARIVGSHPMLTASAYTIVLALGAVFVYHAHPLSMDEYSLYFQSQAFAAGKLSGQFPVDLLDWLVPQPFQGYFLNVSAEDGRVTTSYWPGFALLLTPFTAAGVPWLCNPVLSGVAVLVIHRLALEVLGERDQAGLAVLLSLAAPAFAINGMSFYSMQAHLLCNAAFALCLLAPNARRAVLAGAIGSLALTLHNPVPHALFALPWIAWMISGSARRRYVPLLIAGYLPGCAVLGLGWAWFSSGIASAGEVVTATASFFSTVTAKLQAAFSMPSPGLLRARLIGLAKLVLWAAPAAAVVALFGCWRSRADVRLRLLGWSAVATFAGYLLVPFDQGHGWGFRYFHSVWFVLPLFAAAFSQPKLERKSEVAGYTAGCAVLGVLLVLPVSAYQVEAFIARHLAYRPSASSGDPRLIIISPGMGYYSMDLVQNDPFLREPITTLITHGRKQDAEFVARRFPDLRLLSVDHRGSVWGLDETRDVSSESIASDDHAQQERAKQYVHP